jgi:hypothetical protein
MRKIKRVLAVASAVALLAPAAAFAASGSEQGGYAGSNDVVAGLQQGPGGGGGSGPTGTASTSTGGGGGGSLPFTGSDLGVIGAAGALLLGLGFGLRRLTYRPTRA